MVDDRLYSFSKTLNYKLKTNRLKRPLKDLHYSIFRIKNVPKKGFNYPISQLINNKEFQSYFKIGLDFLRIFLINQFLLQKVCLKEEFIIWHRLGFGLLSTLTKKDNPLVSVIVPFYNSKDFIHSAIDSILAQSYRSIEIIIIDDCSEEPFEPPDSKDEINIKIIRNQKNLGAGESRIKGIKFATGRFISFLDSDDIWFSDKVSIQIDFMLTNSLCMCWTGYIYADNDLNYVSSYMPNNFSNYFSFITKYFTIGCLTCIYDRKYLSDPKIADLKLRNDYQMWLHLFTQIKNNPKLKASPFKYFTAIHRIHKSSLTKSKIKSAYYWWLYLFSSHHSLIFKSFCYLCYFIFTIKLRYFDNDNLDHSSKMQSRISFSK